MAAGLSGSILQESNAMHAADPPDVEVAADSRREEPTLESLFGYLVAIVESGDPDRIQLAWVAAERTLSMRLDGEERTLFAAFFATRAREVRALMASRPRPADPRPGSARSALG